MKIVATSSFNGLNSYYGDMGIILKNFVAFDIELADNNPTSICEIAFVRFRGEEEPQVARALVQPLAGPYVGPMQFLIHGISEVDLVDKPRLGEIWGQFEEFIGDLPLVGHNATQDIKKLISALEEQGCSLENREYFDTLTLARNTDEIIAEVDYSLAELCQQFEIDWFEIVRDSGGSGHSAALDAMGCAQLFLKILDFHEGSVEKALDSLNMKPGVVRGNEVVHGNIKKKSNDYFASLKTFSAKEFEEIKSNLVSSGYQIQNDHVFSGKCFVLTLWFENWTELQIWQAIALAGGQLKTAVTKKVNYLLEGDDPTGRYVKGETSKSKDARDLLDSGRAEIAILSELEFEQLLGTEIFSLVRNLEV